MANIGSLFRKQIALPQDHGSWVFILSPLFIGIFAGGTFTYATVNLSIAAMAAFLVSPRVSRLLDRADANARALEDWQAANLREMRRLHDHAIATPPSLVVLMAKAFAQAEARWREAREANDFGVLAPQLEETVKLVRSKSELLAQRFSLDRWDALADECTPGLLSRDIEAIFTPLTQRLPGLVTEAIELQAAAPALRIEGRFSASRQRGLCTDVMKALGFPFERGRFDESDHPFTEGVPGDIRVTTQLMGKNITLVGGNGDGQTCKVANQIIVALNIEAVGEALLFASKMGADPAKVRAALMGGFASSRVLEVHGERMVKRTFDPGFRIELHRKDLNLALSSARALVVSLPNTATAQELFNSCVAHGGKAWDHSAMVRALEMLANHTVT